MLCYASLCGISLQAFSAVLVSFSRQHVSHHRLNCFFQAQRQKVGLLLAQTESKTTYCMAFYYRGLLAMSLGNKITRHSSVHETVSKSEI